ncbi:MAG TPA: hypothetical protein VIP29_00980 [Nitrososphaeraceae archaeon]
MNEKKPVYNEAYKEMELVYLWELYHEKDIQELPVGEKEVK